MIRNLLPREAHVFFWNILFFFPLFFGQILIRDFFLKPQQDRQFFKNKNERKDRSPLLTEKPPTIFQFEIRTPGVGKRQRIPPGPYDVRYDQASTDHPRETRAGGGGRGISY